MSHRSDAVVGLSLVLVPLVGGILLFILFADYYWTHLWWWIRANLVWIGPIAVLGMIAATGMFSRRGLGPGRVFLLILGVIVTVGYWFGYAYLQQAHYVTSVTATDQAPPAFAPRVPFSVSATQVRSNLGDVPGDTQATMYVPDDQTFSTLVERRGWFTGYETLLEQQISTTGRNTPSTCDLDPERANARLGGWLGANLGRLVNTERRHVSWEQSDAYGWCDPEGTPFVIVPLVHQTGLFVVTEEAAGFALYNGRTGDIDIRTDAEGIPGPTYPLHLAAYQRESTQAQDGFLAWFQRRAGWELPDEADSINSGNQSEFVLAGPDGREFYVTPESGRGAATAISVLTVVDAELRGGGLAPLTVYRLDPVWTSATAITDRIRANFGDVFAQQRDAGIYELAPTGPETWVASIGTPQNLIYRVTGYGDLREDPCLQNLEDVVLRCGPTGDIGVSTGPGVSEPGAPSVDADLSTLTPEQLVDLQQRISEELLRRLGGG